LEKPAIWIDANIHATELAGTTVALHIVHTLLTGYGENERVTRLLDESTVYVLPRINPDGAAWALSDRPRFIRSSTRPYPFEEKAEGLHMEDIDGDGRILQMRIVDPSGDWKVSSLDPRLMEKRKPDEYGGTYYRLFPEGTIENFDGFIIKDAPPLYGLDFNRNFPFEWQPEAQQRGAGPYPASEPEIRAVVDFISRHQNINVGITYHTQSGVILRPYSTKPDEQMETDDLWVFQEMGERGKEITGYPCLSVYHGFRYHPKSVTSGAFDDWVYDHMGIFAFTIELWDLPGRAGIKDRNFIEWFRKHPHEHDLLILKWLEKNAAPGAIVDWYSFVHPQLGPVELGGIDRMYTWRNPPHAFMGEEAERNTPYALALADMLPRLAFHTLTMHRLEDDTYHLNLVVENTGFLPTYTSAQGKKRQAVRPVRVELDLPEGVILVSGRQRTELGHLEGRSNKLGVNFGSATSPTDNRARAEWVLKGSPGAVIGLKVISERAGVLHQRITMASEAPHPGEANA
jgi:murein tripeptide amidase MpaA